MVRTIARPVGLVVGGRGFLTLPEATPGGPGDTQRERVRNSAGFAFCDETEQRVLLAVAGFADEYGIAGGTEDRAHAGRGLSVAEVALKAGRPLPEVEAAMERLRKAKPKALDWFWHRLPPHGLVWVLPDYEDNANPWSRS